MPLSKRQTELLQLLFEQDLLTSEQLAKQLQISNRTLRYEIKAINDQYPEFILSIKGKGYQYNHQHPQLQELMTQSVPCVEGKTEYLYIIKRILSTPEIDYYQLADELYISESTLEKQINALNAIIARRNPQIQITRKHNRLHVSGNEEEHRQIYTFLMNHEMDQYNFDLVRYTDFFASCDLQEVKAYVLEFQRQHHLKMRDFEIISFILHIAIMLERISKGCEIETLDEHQFDQEALDLAQGFAFGLTQRFHIALSDMEHAYLCALFAGKITDTTSKQVQKIKGLVTQIAQGLYLNYDLDVREDLIFQENLLIHLLGLDGRIRSTSFLNNPLIKDIRIHFPLIYDMSVYAAMLVSDYFHTQLIEDEIGYITLHIMSALERINQGTHRSIVLINPFGDMAAKVLQEKCNKIQDPLISIKKTMSLFDAQEIEALHPDLVVSFLPIHEKVTIPVYVLNGIPKDKDIEKIITLLTPQKEQADSASFFHEDLFFTNCSFSNKEEAIHFLCSTLQEKGYCEEGFEQEVFAREQIAPTAYGAQFALPHPIKKCANKNAVAVAILQHAIPWNNRNVKLIFLLCLSSEKDLAFDALFEQLVSLLDEPQKVKRIIKKQTLASFLEELQTS